jgi:hypothetical protein
MPRSRLAPGAPGYFKKETQEKKNQKRPYGLGTRQADFSVPKGAMGDVKSIALKRLP